MRRDRSRKKEKSEGEDREKKTGKAIGETKIF